MSAKRGSGVWTKSVRAPPPGLTETQEEALDRVRLTLGQAPIICILGSTSFSDPDSFPLVQAMARAISGVVGKQATFLTGGMDGVQKAFAESCCKFVKVFNLLPVPDEAKGSDFEVGYDIFAGRALEERKAIFAQLGDIYICVEGGPGVSSEVRKAHSQGKAIVPLMRSGGASAGMFDFPPEALEQPTYATKEQWSLLSDRKVPTKDTATAVAEIILTLLEVKKVERAAQIEAEKACFMDLQGAPAPIGTERMLLSDSKQMSRAFEFLDVNTQYVLDRPQARKWLRMMGWTLSDVRLDAMLSGETPTRAADPDAVWQKLFTKKMLMEICANNTERGNGELDEVRDGLSRLSNGKQAQKQYLLDLIVESEGKDSSGGALTEDEVQHIFRLVGFGGEAPVDVDLLAERLMQGIVDPPQGHEIIAKSPWNGGGIPR